jgi:hypothetical protein
MVPTPYLRKQAEKCRRLARDVSETTTRDRLERLAGEYDAQADFQDNHAPGELRRTAPSED